MKPDDGTCKHYGRIEYEHWDCMNCSMHFLRCPVCMPSYCPDCLNIKWIRRMYKPITKAKANTIQQETPDRR